MPNLHSIIFQCEVTDNTDLISNLTEWYRGVNVKFKIRRASDLAFIDYRTFETIEELRDYVINQDEKNKSCVIYWEDMELLIYDDWIE